jgi:hypothetical protein
MVLVRRAYNFINPSVEAADAHADKYRDRVGDRLLSSEVIADRSVIQASRPGSKKIAPAPCRGFSTLMGANANNRSMLR